MSLWLILNLFFLSINIAVQSLSTASQASPPPNKLSQLLKLSTYLPTAFHLTVSVLSSHLQNIPSSLSVQTLSLTRSSERQNATLSLPNQLFQSFLNSTPPLAKSPATLSPWQPLMTSQPSTTLRASPLQQTSSVYPLGNSKSKGLFFFLPYRFVSSFTHLPIHIPTHPSIYPSIHPSIHLSIHPSIHHPPIHSSIHPSTHACMHASIHPFSHPSIYPCIHLPIHASIQKIHSCIHPSIHQPSHQSTHPHIHPSIYPCMYACIQCIHPFIHPPVHPPLHASIHASMHPSTHTFIHAYTNTYIHASIYTSIHAFRMHASIHRSVHSSPLSLSPPPLPQQNSWVILFLKPNSHWSV